MPKIVTAALACLLAVGPFTAHAQLSAQQQAQVDAIATKTIADTGVPSASVAIVQGNKVVFAKAYGLAHVRPDTPATADMAYPIGSISKQFTATAVLLLAEQGKLSLDDKVAKFFPELTRANDITLRNLLTMTSGYEDYAPQDYIIPAWLHEAKPIDIIHEWAEKPLDFEPGTQWQYSNTNFVLASLIVEKVTGQTLWEFLKARVFQPAGLEGVVNTYTQREKLRVTGYVSYALQPVREQPLEAPGWYYGDGDIAMSAATLLKWDLTVMNETLLTPASYTAMKTSQKLADGTDTHYGLGIYSRVRDGRKEIEHGGEVGGFVAENILFPDDKAAIVVLTNEVASGAANQIAAGIKPLLFATATAPLATDTFAATLRKTLVDFQSGKIDRTLFTPDCNAYFDAAAIKDFQATLAPLGAPQSTERTYMHLRGGMTGSVYKATFANGAVRVSVYLMPDGKIEQMLIVGKL
jgi:CubicO group peptidase (beta-lactamase class C family)